MTPHHAFPDISWADLRAELQREIANRREAFPRMVVKGHMTQAEADRQLDIFAAMIEDAERRRTGQGTPAHAYTWQERRAALVRELDYRARLYPGWIQKGRLTREDAEIYIRRLRCLLAIYEGGFEWRARNGLRPAMWPPEAGTPEEIEARLEWYALQAEVHHRDGNLPMRDGTIGIVRMIDPRAAHAIETEIAAREGTAQQELAV